VAEFPPCRRSAFDHPFQATAVRHPLPDLPLCWDHLTKNFSIAALACCKLVGSLLVTTAILYHKWRDSATFCYLSLLVLKVLSSWIVIIIAV